MVPSEASRRRGRRSVFRWGRPDATRYGTAILAITSAVALATRCVEELGVSRRGRCEHLVRRRIEHREPIENFRRENRAIGLLRTSLDDGGQRRESCRIILIPRGIGGRVRQQLSKCRLRFGKGRTAQSDRIVQPGAPLVDAFSQEQRRAKGLRQTSDQIRRVRRRRRSRLYVAPSKAPLPHDHAILRDSGRYAPECRLAA